MTDRAEPPRREISVERVDGLLALDFNDDPSERLLFSDEEARKLLAELERALHSGFGRDMDAIRRKRT